MKAELLKKMIKEAVREVLKEELNEIVKVSAPVVHEQVTQPQYQSTGNPLMDMLQDTRNGMTKADYDNLGMSNQNQMSPKMAQQNVSSALQTGDLKTIQETVENNLASAPKVGIDISSLPFVKNAAAIVNAATEKQKNK